MDVDAQRGQGFVARVVDQLKQIPVCFVVFVVESGGVCPGGGGGVRTQRRAVEIEEAEEEFRLALDII